MSARDRLRDLLLSVRTEALAPASAEEALDAYDAEVQHPENYPGELAMLRQLVRTLRTVARVDSLAEVQRLLYLHVDDEAAALAEEREKSSRPAADATPGLTDRQARLLDAIRTYGGEWTTRRVLHLFALTDPGVVQRGAARRDLAVLHRAGHLVLVDDPDNRHYALHTRKDGRS
jgi:hypothetical protein